MQCPNCGKTDSKVIDSRSIQDSLSIRRRRICSACNFRYTTYEYIVKYPIMVIKKNGDREEYDRKKIEQSFRIACNKRPIAEVIIQESITIIEDTILDSSGPWVLRWSNSLIVTIPANSEFCFITGRAL